MFRLVFLTFHGERRHDAPAAPAHAEEEEPVAHGASGMIFRLKPEATLHAAQRTVHGFAHGHGHGGHGHEPHEAPWSMALPLILLALGSIFAGYVGVPHALGGSNRIETFLEPSFEAHGASRTRRRPPPQTAPAAEAHAAKRRTPTPAPS